MPFDYGKKWTLCGAETLGCKKVQIFEVQQWKMNAKGYETQIDRCLSAWCSCVGI